MADETPAREQDKFVLRLPDGMRDRLKVEAEANKRSMNAEIVARIQASLEVKGTGSSLRDYVIDKINILATDTAKALAISERNREERIERDRRLFELLGAVSSQYQLSPDAESGKNELLKKVYAYLEDQAKDDFEHDKAVTETLLGPMEAAQKFNLKP